MKKTSIIILLITFFQFSSFAQGTPIATSDVGYIAFYKGTYNGNEYSLSSKLLSFNEQTQLYIRENITTFGTEVTTENEELSILDYYSQDFISMLLNFCEAPKYETVTVAAGTFETCSIVDQQGGVSKIGLVPFGIVKYENSQTNYELVSFKMVE